MTEHLSGYQPEYEYHDGLPCAENDIGDIGDVHSLLAPEELEQMRQSAAAITADMETSRELCVPAPPAKDVPIPIMEADHDEAMTPGWGIEPLDEQLFPEEAPTQQQREHARSYYLSLVSLAVRRYNREETYPEPHEIIEAYSAYKEMVISKNQNVTPDERLPGFTLAHLWAAARRQNLWVMRWLQEQRAYEAPEQYEQALMLLLNLENGSAEAVKASRM